MIDIQDGLFKLILYSNIDTLQLNKQQVEFSTRLKLTGKNIKDRIVLPCSSEAVENFLSVNSTVFSSKEKNVIRKLLIETQRNNNVEIEIRANN